MHTSLDSPLLQLMHTLSKKFVVVNTTKTSRIENTNLRMELTHENSEGCIFKLLPRYKVRSVGDEVSHTRYLIGSHDFVYMSHMTFVMDYMTVT